MSTTRKSNGGIGFFGALAILFIGLKLADKIDWSWWWVLSPIWGVFVIVVLAMVGNAVFVIRENAKRKVKP